MTQQWVVENLLRTYIFKNWISVITVSNNKQTPYLKKSEQVNS